MYIKFCIYHTWYLPEGMCVMLFIIGARATRVNIHTHTHRHIKIVLQEGTQVPCHSTYIYMCNILFFHFFFIVVRPKTIKSRQSSNCS